MTLHATVSGWLLGPPSGANRRLLALVEHAAPLLRAGEQLTVLHGPAFAPPPARPGVHWCAVPLPPGPAWRRARAERRWLPGLLRELGATCHEHGFLPLPRLPVPAALLLHDLRAADGLSRWPRWFARAVLRHSVARAAAVVVPSAFTAARLGVHCPGAAAPAVVPNGVWLPAAAAPPAPGGHLLHVGHLEPRKNLAVVLRALALLPPAARPPLWCAGRDAGAGPALQRLAAQLGIAAAVRWLGVVDDARLQQLHAGARAVVLPSRYEGFGLPALEALAHGRPVLVAAAGALPEVVGDAAVVLPPDDPAAWAAAIAASADDPPGGPAARRARAAAFGWPAAAAAWLAVLRRLGGGGGAAQRTSCITA